MQVFSLLQSAQAAEVQLSDLPMSNLLLELGQLQDHMGPSGLPFEFGFSVVNDTDKDVYWHFHSEVLDPLAFAFFADGSETPIFSSGFSSRAQDSFASQGPVIASNLLVLRSGERMSIETLFERHPGPELFPIMLSPRKAFDTARQTRSLVHGAFLGAMSALVLLFLLSPDFLMNAASRWFAIYLASALCLTMHSHGYGLELLGISADAFFPLLRLMHTFVMLFYLLFVLSFLRARQAYPVYWRCVCLFIVVGLVIAVLEQLLGSGFQSIALMVPATFLLLCVIGTWLAVRDALAGSRFFLGGFSLLLLAGIFNFITSAPQYAGFNEVVDQITLILQLCDALVFGGALLSQMYAMRRIRDEAVQTQLAETQQRLALSQQLLAAESDLQNARSLAERHRTNLAETTHDLRQPIASLRMSLKAAKERSPNIVSDLSDGIEFLDRLLRQALVETRQEPPEHNPKEDQDTTVELQVILMNAQRMFAKEAAEKKVHLKIVETPLVVQTPAIDLIRMVSNLTANAVRYSQKGGILIGARRRGDTAMIQIWDTGPGIPADDLNEILQPYKRGDASEGAEGEGLGLSIVKQLAERNGLDLQVCSKVSKGTVFSITGLPLAHGSVPQLTNK
ncbi:MAG: ATP-binding protein [Pseudomonadota bacterium]